MADGCAVWNGPCHMERAVHGVIGAGQDAVRGMQTVGKAAHFTFRAGADLAEAMGKFFPLLLLGGLIFLLVKLLSISKVAAIGVADGFTGGGASKASNVKSTVAARARQHGRQARVTRETKRGPLPKPGHSGAGVQVIARTNRADGRPSRVVVCAPGPGEAQAAIAQRFSGTVWRPSSVRLCTAGGQQHDYTYTAQYARATAAKGKGKTTKRKGKP